MRQPKDIILEDGRTLQTVLKLHKLWLRTYEERGEQADLRWANLSKANLTRANLSWANLTGADLSDANLTGADLSEANLTGADLSDANLTRADLSDANLKRTYLTGADLTKATLDYSCWPLCCGSLDVKVDKRVFCQLAYHLCSLQVVGEDAPWLTEVQRALGYVANKFHRVGHGCVALPETDE